MDIYFIEDTLYLDEVEGKKKKKKKKKKKRKTAENPER